MPGEQTLPEHYQIAYQRNLFSEFQQETQLLGGTVDDDYNYTEPGDQFTADGIGKARVRKLTDRYGDTPAGDVPDRRRRVGFYDLFDVGNSLGNKIDNAYSVADPGSRIIQEERMAIARNHDFNIMKGIVGTAHEGKTAPVAKTLSTASLSANFKTGAVIPKTYTGFGGPAGDSGFTAAKVQAAKVAFGTRKIPKRMRFCAASENLLQQLINDEKLSSADYNTVKALAAGEPGTWQTFRFIPYEEVLDAMTEAGLALDANTDEAIFWYGDAVQYRSRVFKTPEVWLRKEKRFNWETYGEWQSGAVRTHDDAVLRCKCAV